MFKIRFMLALAERTNEDHTNKIQLVMEDLRRVESEVKFNIIFYPFSYFHILI